MSYFASKLYDDPFTRWLKARGTEIGVYQPMGELGKPPIGREIVIGKSTIVYRITEEKPNELIVVLLKRKGERSGLHSPFADFARFIALVKKSEAPIEIIRGHVDEWHDLPEDHVTKERIGAFYKRYLAADIEFVENDVEWVAGHLPSHKPPLSSGKEVLESD